MAYVGISTQLKEAISEKLSAMHKAEYTKLVRPELTGKEEWLVDAAWGAHKHLMELMPKEWMRAISNFDIHVIVETVVQENGLAKPVVKERRWVANNQVMCPPGTEWYFDIKTHITSQWPDDNPFVVFMREEHALERKYRQVRTQLTTFLDKCKSLNEAVKLWPGIAMYVPKEYLDKLEQRRTVNKSDPSEAIAVLEKLDTDAMTALAVTHRIGAI